MRSWSEESKIQQFIKNRWYSLQEVKEWRNVRLKKVFIKQESKKQKKDRDREGMEKNRFEIAYSLNEFVYKWYMRCNVNWLKSG